MTTKHLKNLQELLEEGLQSNILPDKNILKAAINKSCTNLEALLSNPDGSKDVQNLLYAVQNIGHQDEPLLLDLLFQCQIQKLIFTVLLSENCKKVVNKDVGSIFEHLLDVVNGIAELSSSAKGSMVTDFLELSLDLLTRTDVGFRHRMEVLKSTNLLLENCPFVVKEKFLNSDLFLNKLKAVVNQLQNFGDYEFQVGLIECLFRIIPRKQRESFVTSNFFSNSEFSRGLLQIQDSDFETDCRLFLNGFNNSLGAAKRVLSLPCTSAFLGDKELYKPNEPGYDEFWVDFNLTSQRVTVFCEQESVSSQNSADDLWETVTVWIKDLENFGITRKKNYVVAHLFLQKSISEIFPSQCDVDGKEVQFHFDQMVDVEDALIKTFGNEYFIKKPEPKVSTVNNPILISNERKHTEEQQEQKPQQQQNFSELSNSQLSQGTPSLHGRKVSVPCVPMSTPSSVSSLKSYQNKNAFSADNTCINNTNQRKQFRDVDDSSKSTCFKNLSAPSSNIQDDSHRPKNKCTEMLDKDKINQKKEFQVPKTPNLTRSKVKVKTPVVVVTPRSETENSKGKGKKSKKDKRSKAKASDKDLKDEDLAEEEDKTKKTTKKKKDQCDKFIQQEICLLEQNEENNKDDNISNESKVDEDGKEVKKRSSRISEKNKELSKSDRNMKNEKVTKQEKTKHDEHIHVIEEEEDDVIIPSSMIEERTSDNQISAKSDRLMEINLLQNLHSNHDEDVIDVSDNDTVETNDKQVLNRKVESPLSETNDSSQCSNEGVQEMKNNSGSNSSAKDNKELLSNTKSDSASGSKAKLKTEMSYDVDVIPSSLEPQEKIMNNAVRKNTTENNVNENKYSGKPKRSQRLNKEKIFQLKNYDLYNADDVIQSSLDSERTTSHISPKSKQVCKQKSKSSLCTAESPLNESTARTRDHMYDFTDNEDDTNSEVKKPDICKRIKSSAVSKEVPKQPVEKKETKGKQLPKRAGSKTLCDLQHNLSPANDTSCDAVSEANVNYDKGGKSVNEENDCEMTSTRSNKRGRKTRKQTREENSKDSTKNHKHSSVKSPTVNSVEDEENDCLYGDNFETEVNSSEFKNKLKGMSSKHDKNNMIKDQCTKKSLQKNKTYCMDKEQTGTKSSKTQLNPSCDNNEEDLTENSLPDKCDTVFRDKTNNRSSSARGKTTNSFVSKKDSMQNLESKVNHFNTDSPKVFQNKKMVRSTGISYNSKSQKSESTFNRNSVTTVYMTYCATESLNLPSEKGDASKDPYDFDLDCELSQQYDQYDTSNDNKRKTSKSRSVSENKSSKNHSNDKRTDSAPGSNAVCEEYEINTANKYIKNKSMQKNMSYSKVKLCRYEESKRNSKSRDHQLCSKHQTNRSKENFLNQVQNSSRVDSDASQEEQLKIRKDSSPDAMCNEDDNILANFSRICQGIVSGADIDAEDGSPSNSSKYISRQNNERLGINADGNINKHIINDKLQSRKSTGTEPSSVTTTGKSRLKSFNCNSTEESDCEITNEYNIKMITPSLNKAFSGLSDRSSRSASSKKKAKRKRKQVNYKENSESDIEELDEEGSHNNPLRIDSDKDLSCLQDSRFLNDSRSEVSWILKKSNKKKPEKVYKREKRFKRLCDNSETEESEIDTRDLVMPEIKCDNIDKHNHDNARKSRIGKSKRKKSILRTPMTPAGDHIAYIDEEYNFMPVLSLEALVNHCSTQKTNSTIDDIGSIRSCISSLRTPKTPATMCSYYEIQTEDVDEDQEHDVGGNLLAVQSGFVSGPSTDIRPTRTSLKRKYKDVAFDSEESQKSSDDVEDCTEDENLESSKLIPRKLFKEEIKVIKRTCEDESTSNRSTSDNQTDINFDLPDEEHNSTYSGVSTLLNAFSGDIQRQMQAKKQHLEKLTKAAVKSTHREISKSWWDQHDFRQKVLHDFKNKLMLEVLALETDISKVKDAEDETLAFFRKQLQVIQNHRLSQAKRLRNLNELQNSFYENMMEAENTTEKQKSLKDVIRKDLTTLQKKLLQESQQQELMNVKKSLHSMLQYS